MTRRPTNVSILEPPTLPIRDLIPFYTLNAPAHAIFILKTVKDLHIDVVFGAHLLHSLSGALASKACRCVSVYDFCDYFPESASIYYPSGLIMKRAIESAVYRISQLNLELADVCTAPSLPLLRIINLMTARHGQFVPNGVDTTLFRPRQRDEKLAESLGISPNSIAYVGSIEGWLDLDTVLDGLKLLISHVRNAQLVLIGSRIKTDYYSRIRLRARRLGLEDHLINVGTVTYEDLPRYLSAVAACIIPFRTDLFLSRIALPNKLFEYMASGKPILSTGLPEVRRLVNDSIFFYETSVNFSRQAKRILEGENDTIVKQAVERNVMLAASFDWERIAMKLESIVSSAVQKKR
jgi:glycosyltransferase involved in cell wall biosynthesis